jgi:hypothetical protein
MGMRRVSNTTICELTCTCCGTVFPIQRKSNKLKEDNHIKDLWCVKCKKETKHIEKPMPYPKSDDTINSQSKDVDGLDEIDWISLFSEGVG